MGKPLKRLTTKVPKGISAAKSSAKSSPVKSSARTGPGQKTPTKSKTADAAPDRPVKKRKTTAKSAVSPASAIRRTQSKAKVTTGIASAAPKSKTPDKGSATATKAPSTTAGLSAETGGQGPTGQPGAPLPRPDLPNLVQRAISFAARVHTGQRRRDGITPYAAHPMRVVFTTSQLFGINDPEVLAAAALHDVVEDTPVRREEIAEEFTEDIAELVILLTKNERLPQPQRDDQYYAELAQADWRARALKMADAYDNLLDSAASPDGPRAKRLKIARRCLSELVNPEDRQLQRAAEILQNLVDLLDPDEPKA